MKKLLTLSFTLVLSIALFAQKGKNKPAKEDKPKKEARETILGSGDNKKDGTIWEGTSGHENANGKASKNQPAKVRAAFSRDYPNATNVQWSKYRGDWTATFTNGIVTSTAVYHANGTRKDTRTIIARKELPNIILGDIAKKEPANQSEVVKIEIPGVVRKTIYRVKTSDGRYVYYDANGAQTKYDY